MNQFQKFFKRPKRRAWFIESPFPITPHPVDLPTLQLYSVLYGSGDEGERFESFVAALEELEACKWTTATYFLYLSDPNRYPFVKPSNISIAAKSYAFDICYTSRPNWQTYTRIIDFVHHVASLLERRATLKPRDLIDVQSFIWCALQNN